MGAIARLVDAVEALEDAAQVRRRDAVAACSATDTSEVVRPTFSPNRDGPPAGV